MGHPVRTLPRGDPLAEAKDITRILAQVRAGDPDARDELFRIAYDELHRRAHFQRRSGPASETLNTTVLVHEAFLKLAGSTAASWDDRGHFYRVAARAMRQILIDQARRRLAKKRGEGAPVLDVDDFQVGVAVDASRLVALDEALSRLQQENRRLAEVVELRFFSGLSVDETASAMGVSERTVKRDWRLARAYLHGQLEEQSDPD
jgi:RNA polymerase sigma factor (TIGR02999 family)